MFPEISHFMSPIKGNLQANYTFFCVTDDFINRQSGPIITETSVSLLPVLLKGKNFFLQISHAQCKFPYK